MRGAEERGACMPLTREEVAHIAELAKLGLTEEEMERFREQLSAILDYAAKLQELDTSAIPPTASVLDLQNVMRPDQVRPSRRIKRPASSR